MMRPSAVIGLLTLGAALATAPVALARSGDVQRTTKQLAQAIESWNAQAEPRGGYDAPFTRDPLQSLVNGQGQVVGPVGGFQSGLSVQGIIWSEGHPMAVIDDELVGEGATVGRYTVMKISQDRVEVQAENEAKVVLLDRGVDPKPTPATPASP